MTKTENNVINLAEKIEDKAFAEAVADELASEELTNEERQEGYLAGQMNAFMAIKTVEEAMADASKTDDFSAAFLVGFLEYFVETYNKLEADMKKQLN